MIDADAPAPTSTAQLETVAAGQSAGRVDQHRLERIAGDRGILILAAPSW